MGIKAIDYENLKDGDLITWYGVHVLKWEDEIRPYGIEPTIAFVQDDTLEKQNASMLKALKGIKEVAHEYIAEFDDDVRDVDNEYWVDSSGIGKWHDVIQAIAQAEGGE